VISDEQFYEFAKSILAKTMHLEARCDSLEIVVATLAIRSGISQDKILKMIDQVRDAQFQKRLERAESVSPEVAADIDYRTELPDIPDELLE